jgi:hypothetical protein
MHSSAAAPADRGGVERHRPLATADEDVTVRD